MVNVLSEDGLSNIPGRYIIHLHPSDLSALRLNHPISTRSFNTNFMSIADKMGVRLREHPQSIYNEDVTMVQQTVRISPVELSIRQD